MKVGGQGISPEGEAESPFGCLLKEATWTEESLSTVRTRVFFGYDGQLENQGQKQVGKEGAMGAGIEETARGNGPRRAEMSCFFRIRIYFSMQSNDLPSGRYSSVTNPVGQTMAAKKAESAPLTFDLTQNLLKKVEVFQKKNDIRSKSKVIREAIDRFDYAEFKPEVEDHCQISVRLPLAQKRELVKVKRQKKVSFGVLLRAALEALPETFVRSDVSDAAAVEAPAAPKAEKVEKKAAPKKASAKKGPTAKGKAVASVKKASVASVKKASVATPKPPAKAVPAKKPTEKTVTNKPGPQKATAKKPAAKKAIAKKPAAKKAAEALQAVAPKAAKAAKAKAAAGPKAVPAKGSKKAAAKKKV